MKAENKRRLDALEKWLENAGERENNFRNIFGRSPTRKEFYNSVRYSSPLPSAEEGIQSLIRDIEAKYTEESCDMRPIGVYLSYIVNEVYPAEEIRIKLTKTFGRLGIFNSKKKWIIDGDVDSVGQHMSSGKITVNGDGGYFIGDDMQGGEIHLNGDYMSISDNVKGGKIFHKRKIILQK